MTELSPSIEREKKSGIKVIGVIGPHGIGKDTVIEGLVEKMPEKVRAFSIGEYIRKRLYETEDTINAEQQFAKELEDARVESEDLRLNNLTGLELVGEIKHKYENRMPIPQEVADWIFRGFIETCSRDTVVLLSGGPYSLMDLKFMEQHHPPEGLILLAPASKKWMEEIPRRNGERGRVSGDPQLEWEKWKRREAEVLRYTHKMGHPVLHVNLEDPSLSKEEVERELLEDLHEFVQDVSSGKAMSRLRIVKVGGKGT